MKNLFKIASLVLFTVSMGLSAASPQPFSEAVFKQAQSKEKFIVLHFYADWCPSCTAQKKILDPKFTSDDFFRRVVFLRVPFDDALQLRKEMKVSRQSTLIIYKGPHEIAREAGTVSREGLESFFKKNIPLE